MKDSWGYMFSCCERLAEKDFVPRLEDIVRVRIEHCVILEEEFEYHGMSFKVIDIGGLKSESRKWIHHFDDASILFVVNLLSIFNPSELEATVELYQRYVQDETLFPGTFILLLNQLDLFQEQCQAVPLPSCRFFEGFSGKATEIEDLKNYIVRRFMAMDEKMGRSVSVHFTVAIDLYGMGKVLSHLLDITIKDRLVYV
eukprot:TRINITY_DN22577_c0_g1_i1.p1 TRINITY_DN22577_c0_g1~~TRINITY_DN22577_c0_g1_i1.p1  ORF type:complete len:210 (+),score=50.60 TRINITY_DN22577_c0_g1_i1:34-630(+)